MTFYKCKIPVLHLNFAYIFIARQRRSMLMRDIDIAYLSVRPSVRQLRSGTR